MWYISAPQMENARTSAVRMVPHTSQSTHSPPHHTAASWASHPDPAVALGFQGVRCCPAPRCWWMQTLPSLGLLRPACSSAFAASSRTEATDTAHPLCLTGLLCACVCFYKVRIFCKAWIWAFFPPLSLSLLMKLLQLPSGVVIRKFWVSQLGRIDK